MRAYPLRLKDELADAARRHADSLGISFNALVAVALDAYLHGDLGHVKPAKLAPPKTKSRPAKRAIQPESRPVEQRGRWHRDPGNWRNFHEPDVWPYVDPRWKPPAGVVMPGADFSVDPDSVTPEQLKAFEDAYWSTHKRPARPLFEESEIPH